MAVRDACVIGFTRGIVDLVICSDSKQVIYLASSNLEPPWAIEKIICDICRAYAQSFRFLFKYFPKSLNLITHWIVRTVVKNILPYNWAASSP